MPRRREHGEFPENAGNPTIPRFPFRHKWFILEYRGLWNSLTGFINVSRVIDCPQCGRKLAIKPDLTGKRLKCPQCKEPFLAPNGEEVPPPQVWDETAAENEGYGVQEETKSPGAGRPPGSPPPRPRRAPSGQPSAKEPEAPSQEFSPLSAGSLLDELGPAGPAAALASMPPSPSRTRAKAGGGKQGQIPKEWIIGGAIGGGVLLLLLIVVVVSLSGPRKSGGSAKEKEDVKWNLKKRERERIFGELFAPIDENYTVDNDRCKQGWQRIAASHKITMDVVFNILDEGFEAGWDRPGLEKVTAQNKANRRIWIADRTRLGRDPLR